MKPPREAALAAYVLHQWDWSETSLIVELFTRSRGRIAAAAKGAKRPTSHLRAVLLPFNRLQVQLGRGSVDEAAEIVPLRHAEWAGGAPTLGGPRLMAGFYLNELVQRGLARNDPHPQLFDAYAQALAALGGEDEATVLRSFELTLLRELGWLPELAQVTATLQPLVAQGRYALRADMGLVAETGGVEGARWMAIDAALTQGSAAALRQAVAPAAAALRGMLRAALAYHLGVSQLRTRHVLQSLQQLLAQAASR
jgi:DNA repair protein RecO (recombination protein O)